MEKIKTLFFGSGEFAVPVLEALLELDFIDIEAVVTQPDKPVGRKQILTPTEVGQFIASKSIEIDVLKPEKLRSVSQDLLKKYAPELIIVASYGQIVHSDIIGFPKFKCLNLHGSILPLLRGAVPVPMAILQGFKETGVTMQVMGIGMDEGPIVSSEKYDMPEDIDSEKLMTELSLIGANIVRNDLKKWIDGEIEAIDQDSSKATYCWKTDIEKSKAEITFDTPVEVAERMVRAFYPWPVAWFRIRDGKVVKVFKVGNIEYGIQNIESNTESSQLIAHSPKLLRVDKKLYLQMKDGLLEILELQLEGKNRDLVGNYFYLAGK